MRHFYKRSMLLVATLAFGAFAAIAFEPPTDLNVRCGDQNNFWNWDDEHDDNNCREGMITFRGRNYPEAVSLQVLSYPVGTLIDSAVYGTVEGRLKFTQTLVPYGAYQVIVYENNEGVQGNVITTKNIVVDPH